MSSCRSFNRRPARLSARSALGVVGLAGALAGAAAFSGAASAAPRKQAGTAKAVVVAVRKAILSQSAVRLSSTSRSATTHKILETAVFDAGRTSSSQRYRTTTGRLSILVSPTAAWFTGNAAGLTSLFGVPPSLVGKIGRKWVMIGRSQVQYKDLAAAVLSSVPSQVLPSASAKGLRLSSSTDAGAHVRVLTWTDASSGTRAAYRLIVAGMGRALPILETETTSTATLVTSFGHWNEHVVVTAPHPTINFSVLAG
jgi:hypothetical protein